ncbi:MAG: DUF2147 domain-containing protein [Pseudomonadota bacterium]
MTRFLLFACLFVASLTGPGQSASADDVVATDVTGYWTSHTGGLVEFKPCDGAVCGVLKWEPQWDETGTIPLDDKNPDETLRDRPIKGVTILYGFKETRRGWRRGTFYSPWEGKFYPANVRRLDEETLRLQGCIARILCQSFEWTRAERPLAAPTTETQLVNQ